MKKTNVVTSKKRFPFTLPRDLRKHYQKNYFRSKIDFMVVTSA